MERTIEAGRTNELTHGSSQAANFSAALLKVASRCNLDCDYCYVYKHADQSWRDLPRFMSSETIERFALRLKDYLTEEGLREFSITFHGGEPLLFSSKRLLAASEQIRSIIGDDVSLDFSLQTNGVLLDEGSLLDFEKGDIGVSISLDGPRTANDRHRLDHAGESTFDNVDRAIDLLKKWKSDLFRGVIAVIDPEISPRVLLEFFADLNVPRLDLLLPDATHVRIPPGREGHSDLYSNWLSEAFRLWYQEYSHIPIRWFDAILASRAGVPSPTDAMGLGAVSLVVIDTDGAYTDHDVFKITRHGAPALGNTVQNASLKQMASHPTLMEHNSRLQLEGLAIECKTCPVVEACGGGSVMHRWHSTRGLEAPSVYCSEIFAVLEEATSLLCQSIQDDSTTTLRSVSMLGSGDEFVEQCRIWRSDCDQRAVALHPENKLRGSESAAAILLENQNLIPGMAQLITSMPSHLDIWLGRIKIQSNDRRLIEPFKDSIRLLPANSAQVSHGLKSLSAAADLLRLHTSALPIAMSELISDILFVESTLDAEGGIFSFSDDSAPNVLYIAPYAGGSPLPPEDIADSLLHELLHQALYHTEKDGLMLFDHVYPRFPAPWCKGLRPSGGFLHGTYVFTGLSAFWKSIAERAPDEALAAKGRRNFDLFSKNAAYGIRSLRQFSLLTERGRLLLSQLAEIIQMEASQRMDAPGALVDSA